MSPGPVYLVDSYGFKPPEDCRVHADDIAKSWEEGDAARQAARRDTSGHANGHANGHGDSISGTNVDTNGKSQVVEEAKNWNDTEVRDFVKRVFDKSGLSPTRTYLPKNIHPKYIGSRPVTSVDDAYEECKMCVCGAVEGLLKKTGLEPRDVDILITTCSIFCPTPSMAAMVVNHFKMRSNIKSYHLGGMGCSNGVLAVDLVKDLLQANKNANVVFVTNETTTAGLYKGKDRHRLVTNVIFRMGAAAVLFSNNKRAWRGRIKYKLEHNTRVNTAAIDEAHRCIWYGPDDDGMNGIHLGYEVVKEAGRAVTKALMQVAPLIMTWRQYGETLLLFFQSKLNGDDRMKKYRPSFSESAQHFLIHAGGSKVLDGLGSNLKLTQHDLEPSRAVLHDYGNVSSSTTWYTMGFVETVRGVKRGDKVFQVGVGSGIKCAINIWRALRTFQETHEAWAHRLAPEWEEEVRQEEARAADRGEAPPAGDHGEDPLGGDRGKAATAGVGEPLLAGAQRRKAAGQLSVWPARLIVIGLVLLVVLIKMLTGQ